MVQNYFFAFYPYFFIFIFNFLRKMAQKSHFLNFSLGRSLEQIAPRLETGVDRTRGASHRPPAPRQRPSQDAQRQGINDMM